MNKRAWLLLLLILGVNLILITLPLSIKNHRLEKANQDIRLQLQGNSQSPVEQEKNYYQMAGEIESLIKNSSLSPKTQSLSMSGHLRLELVLSSEKKELAEFCHELRELSEFIYLTEARMNWEEPSDTLLVLEYFGEDHD